MTTFNFSKSPIELDYVPIGTFFKTQDGRIYYKNRLGRFIQIAFSDGGNFGDCPELSKKDLETPIISYITFENYCWE